MSSGTESQLSGVPLKPEPAIRPEDLLVIKFGGTSLGSPGRMRMAARRVRVHVRAGRRVVVVVSAIGHTTDRILGWANSVAGRGQSGSAREIDRALATGEELAAAMMAVALRAVGVPAVSLRGGEAGIEAAGAHGRGTISDFRENCLRQLLCKRMTPVVAGFQAAREDGETVTLGRGGSDVTAVFLAGALGAAACHIVTDVDGVFDRDPRRHVDARRFPEMTHQALIDLADSGAKVVHRAAAREASRSGIPLHIYGFRSRPREPHGTRVGEPMVRSSRRESHSSDAGDGFPGSLLLTAEVAR